MISNRYRYEQSWNIRRGNEDISYTIGNGWSGVEQIKARSKKSAIKKIKKALGVVVITIHIWKV